MKQGFKVVLIAFICAFSTGVAAQSEYTITFEQTMETNDTLMQQTLEMMGEMSTLWYIKDSKFRSETNAGMTGTTTVIYDANSEEILMLMESPFLGNTYISITDTMEAEVEEPTIIKTKEKKKIAGYQCVKYVITDVSGVETTVYATDKIKNPFKAQYGGGIDGAILYSKTESTAMGAAMTIIMVATEVKKGAIPAEKFSMNIPEGYTEFDQSGM